MRLKRAFIVLIMLAIILFTNSIVFADAAVPSAYMPDNSGHTLIKCIIIAFIVAIIVTLIIIFINKGKGKNKNEN